MISRQLTFSISIFVFGTAILVSDFCQGQDPRIRRRQFVEDLLKGLIESQLDNNRPERIPGGNPNLVPPRPQLSPPPTVDVSPKMREVRKTLKQWNRSCDQLINELRELEIRSPAIRPYLADTLQVKAEVEVLANKASIYPTVDPLVEDFRLIDRDWRLLTYHLKYSNQLSPKCRRILETMGKLDQQLCAAFQIEAQMDRNELIRLGSQLSSDYNHLLHDVYYVVRSLPEGRAILNQGQNLQLMMSRTTALLPRGSYDNVVQSYQDCVKQWKAYSRKLRPIQDERIRRSIADIEATKSSINEQLWLPVELDREYLGYLNDIILEDSNQIFQSVSLNELARLPDPPKTLSVVADYRSACEDFGRSLKSSDPKEDLDWKFRLFKVQWLNLKAQLNPIQVPVVVNKLQDVGQAVSLLDQRFGESPPINRNALIQLTANLTAVSQQLAYDVHRNISSPNYEQDFEQKICNQSERFARDASLIHRQLIVEPSRQVTSDEFGQLFDDWRSLKAEIVNCKPAQQAVFQRSLVQLEPVMVKLLVVFSK